MKNNVDTTRAPLTKKEIIIIRLVALIVIGICMVRGIMQIRDLKEQLDQLNYSPQTVNQAVFMNGIKIMGKQLLIGIGICVGVPLLGLMLSTRKRLKNIPLYEMTKAEKVFCYAMRIIKVIIIVAIVFAIGGVVVAFIIGGLLGVTMLGGIGTGLGESARFDYWRRHRW